MTTTITLPRPPSRDSQHARLLRLLRELRVGNGAGLEVTHRAVARGLGVSPWHWSKIVNGQYAPVSEQPPYSRWRTWAEFEAAVREAVAQALA